MIRALLRLCGPRAPEHHRGGRHQAIRWAAMPGLCWLLATGLLFPAASFAQATDTDIILTLVADQDPVPAGSTLVYTVTVMNNGPADAEAVMVTSTLDPALTLVQTDGCIEDPTAVPDCGLGTLALGAMSSFTMTATVPPDGVGTLTTTSEASTATTDTNPGNNDLALATGIAIQSDLALLLSDAPDPVIASQTITYTAEVINNGPSDASGVQLTTTTAAGTAIETTVGCSEDPSGAPTCTVGDLAAGDSTLVTLEARVGAGTTGDLETLVEVSTTGTDPTADNNAATQTTTSVAEADLEISTSDDPDPATAGETLTYTVFIENNGPSNATNVTVGTLLPSGVTLVETSGCGTDPMGVPVCGLGDMTVGSTFFFQVTVTLDTDLFGSLDAQFFVSSDATDPSTGNNEAIESTTVIGGADLSVSKTDGVTSAVPGESVTYTIVVENAGPSDALGAVVSDPFPAVLDCIWDCIPDTGATCSTGQTSGDIDEAIDLPAGLKATYTAVCQIDSAATGNLSNTVTVTPPPGVPDPDPLDDTASDLDTVLQKRSDLRLTKTDGIDLTAPGQTVTYTIQVFNDGPSDALGALVSDIFPSEIENVTWTCGASAGSSCTGTGTGDLADTVNIAAGGVLTYTASGTVASDASGSLTNRAAVDPPAGHTDPNLNNNEDTDFDTQITDQLADLVVSKTDGVTEATPGDTVTYTMTVRNDGPSAVVDASVVDTFAAELSCIWSCVPDAGASCAVGQVAGDIDDSVDLPAATMVTYTAVCQIDTAATGALSNTVTAATPATVLDPDPEDNTAADLDTVLRGRADLAITKDDGLMAIAPGQSLTYTITVTNAGPSDGEGAAIADTFPTAIENVTWTCTASAGSSCTPAGVGDLSDTVNVLANGTLTYLATGTVADSAVGTLVNSATVTAPEGLVDPNTNNNVAVDFDTAIVDVLADLTISKTDGLTQAAPGDSLTYTIAVSNAGPAEVLGATVTDTFPPELDCIWQCTPTGGAQCAAGQVAGDIAQQVNLPVGAVATFSAVCRVDPAASGTLTNTATVGLPAGTVDPNLLDNSAADLDTVLLGRADLVITKSDGITLTAPGQSLTYTITVSNAGPSDVSGAMVTDTFPAEIENVTWTCVAGAGANCAAGGVGDIADTIALPSGASIVYQATGTVASTAVGTLSNTATVTEPMDVVDPVQSNNTAIDFDTALTDTLADLGITKTDGVTSATPGDTISYTITVTNAGPADVLGARVGDVFPQSLDCLWTCAVSMGAQCTAGQVAGNIDHLANLPVGSSVVYTALCTIDGAASGTLQNTASITPPSTVLDPNLLDNSAADLDTVLSAPQVDLAITKTDGQTTAVPGEPLMYTVVVTNTPVTFGLLAPPEGLPRLVSLRPDDGSPDPPGITELATMPATWSAECDRPAAEPLGFDSQGWPVVLCQTTAGTRRAWRLADHGWQTLEPARVGFPSRGPASDPLITRAPWDGSLLAVVDGELVAIDPTVSTGETEGASPGDPLAGELSRLGPAPADLVALAFDPTPENVSGAQVLDDLPSVLTCQWTCTSLGGASCTAGPVVGDLADSVVIPFGGRLTYTASCMLAADAIDGLGGTTLDNTASVVAPPGVVDIDSANDSATDSDTVVQEADLSITKSDGRTSAAPGDALAYQITVRNLGPSDVSGVVVADTFPTELENPVWVCTASVGSACTAAGVGDLSDTVILRAGGVLTYLASATVADDAGSDGTGTLVNTATVTAPEGITDPIANNNTAIDFDTVLVPVADLAITKSDGLTSAIPGEMVTWVITVVNSGPSAISGATVSDTFPNEVTGVSWSCSASAGAVCAAAGTGNLNDSVTLPAGGLLTYTATGTLATDAEGSAPDGRLVNTATVAVPAGVVDPDPGDNSASDLDTLVTPRVDLAITKTDGVTSAVPGGALTYTLVASNAGPSDVTGAKVRDLFPASLDCLWTCVAASGARCTPGQVAGNIDDTVDLPVGGTATYTAICQIDPAASGTLANTATVTPPGGVVELAASDNSASDLDTVLSPSADLRASKSDGRIMAAPGETITWTITLNNDGPSNVPDAVVSDVFPTEVENVSWTCTGSGGANCVSGGVGNLDQTVDLPVGGRVTYQASATVRSDATGTLSNTVTVDVPSGITDPDAANNSATDADTALVPRADLVISKSDGITSAVPGETITYTIAVRNDGPSASQATVADTFSTETSCTWTCVGTGGALCAPGPVSGDIADTITLSSGGLATYTASCAIASSAVGNPPDGKLANTATVTAAEGTTDPNLTNNTASDLDTVLARAADLRITKTDGRITAVPGESITYTIVASNPVGPSDVTGATVSDLFPITLDCSWSCVAAGGASCAAGPVQGDLVDTVALPVGGSATYSADCTIDVAAAGVLSNTASINPPAGTLDPQGGNNTATDNDTALEVEADLTISKSDGVTSAVPGESITYTIEVGNNGPNPIFGARVVDTFPAVLDCLWGCSVTGGGVCTPGQVAGDIDDLINLQVGAIATYTATCQIDSDATGTLANTATVSAPLGATDPATANNSASDLDTVLAPEADLRITKSDGVTSATPGESISYTVQVRNPVGPSSITDAQVIDLPPATLDCSWICTGSGGASCTAGPVLDALDDLATIPVGGIVTYTGDCVIDPLATGTLSNTATVEVPAGATDPVSANDTATDDNTVLVPRVDVRLTVDDQQTVAIPGQSTTYTVTVSNPATFVIVGPVGGPSFLYQAFDKSVSGALVRDLFPAALDCSWTCTASGGATCTAGPVSGDLLDTVDLPVGATLVYTAQCAIDPAATGTLVNNADIVLPGDVVDGDPSNNADSDTDTLQPTADLVLSKTDGVTSAIPGGSVTYTLVASNPDGPSTIQDLTVGDVFPTGLACIWGCTQSGGATCTPGQVAGNISDTLDLTVGAIATYTATCQIPANAFGVLQNTAQIGLPAGAADPDLNNNTAADLDTVLTPQADLSITKTDGVTTATAGDSVTYTITVRHLSGPSGVVAARVEDDFPNTLDCLWTCAPQLGASCAAGQNTGPLFDLADLPKGSRVVYTAECQIDPGANGTLSNTATVTLPPEGSDPDLSNNSATDADTVLTTAADLRISKSDGLDTVEPAQPITYTVVASNPGPSDAPDTTVSDVFPTELRDCSWTCQRSGGATCTQGPVSGDLADTFDLPVGAMATYTIACTVTDEAEGQLINSATIAAGPGVEELDPGNDTATDIDTVFLREADLTLSKSDGVDSAPPGGSVTYTITAANPVGPAAIEGATVEDLFPTSLDCTWTCSPTGGASCAAGPVSGDLQDTVDLPVGASAVYTAVCQIDAGTGSPDGTTVLSNTATLTPPVGGIDPDLSNNTATDDDTFLVPDADLLITKSDGLTTAVPGEGLSYTISIENPGPSDLPSATVSDTLPSALSCTWSCVASAGASCTTVPPPGDLSDTVALPVGGELIYTGLCTIDSTATGTLSNTAVVSWPTGSRSASDTDTVLVRFADLAIGKSDGTSTATPGGTTTYAITVSNSAGPSQVIGARVRDIFPSTLDCSWTCTPSSGATCTAGPVAGPIDELVTLPVGGSLAYSATCAIASGATGSVANTATVTPPVGTIDPNLANNSATDVDGLGGQSDLGLTKVGNPASVVPGQTLTYTLTVTNDGPSDVFAVTVVDTLPDGLTFESATASGFGTPIEPGMIFRDGFESGDLGNWGPKNDLAGVGEKGAACTASGQTVTCQPGGLVAGGTGTITLVTRVDVDAPAGNVTNTATVSGTAGDPDASDNTATALNTVGNGDTDVGIVMDDSPDPVAAGGTLTYDLVITNHGPAVATGVRVTDNLPPETTYQFATAGQGSCGNDVGVVVCQLGMLAAGATTDVSIVVQVSAEATAALTNPAVVAADQVDPNAINDSDTETTTVTSDLKGGDAKGPPGEGDEVPEIPTLHPAALALLALLLLMLGWRRLGRDGR